MEPLSYDEHGLYQLAALPNNPQSGTPA